MAHVAGCRGRPDDVGPGGHGGAQPFGLVRPPVAELRREEDVLKAPCS